MCVCVRERVSVCVRERVCVCVRERVSVCEREIIIRESHDLHELLEFTFCSLF